MALGHSGPQYELLNGQKKHVQPVVHSMVVVGLSILMIFVVVLMFYVSWMKFEGTNDQNTPMDFVLFGPQKYTNSDTASYRAHTFAIAAKSNHKNNWTAVYKDSAFLKTRVDKMYHLACYYSIPAQNTSNTLRPAQINSTLCTHIIVSFAQVQNNTVYFKSSFDVEILKEVVKLRQKSPELKVLLSLIHFSNGSNSNEGFSGVVANRENINKFVNNVVSVVRKFYLDGIDIDWEFPSWPLLNLKEKHGFAKLLESLHEQLPDSLLTAAVAAPLSIIDNAYDIFSLASFVDFINIMTYDYHSYQWYFPLTGPNSPLYSARSESGFFQSLNVNASIQYWISKGMPKEKILLGMPTYGHSFRLMNKINNGFDAPSSGFGGIGEGGFVTFPEVCDLISHQNATVVFDHDTRTPYAYHNNDWVSFENENSIAYKAEFAASLGLGGAMVFSLNTDDYIGSSPCSSSVFPLTSRVKLVINDDYL